MKNLRTIRKSLNNNDQLIILNGLYHISNSPNKIYKLTYKKEKAKTIYLEKKSPNHYPIYMKFIKKNRNRFKRLDNLYSYGNMNYKEYNFDNSYDKNNNSFYTDKRQKKTRLSYNPLDLNIINKITDKNESEIKKLKKIFENSQKRKNKEENYRLRYNRIISISPSKRSNKENSKLENKNESNSIKEIKIENNIKNNKEDNNINASNNDDKKYNYTHKMRYLLSKNYCSKKIIKKKYNNKSPYSIISRFKKNSTNSKKNNLINLDINNINNLKNNINYDNIKNINTESSPYINLNKTDINRNYKLEEKYYNNNNIFDSNNNPLDKADIQTDQQDIINNIFLKNKNIDITNNEIEIKLNDLIIIEERINDIIMSLNNIKYIMDIKPINSSILFFSFYFNSSLKNKFPLFFNIKNRIIIKSAFNIIIFMILLIYHLSLNPSMMNKVLLLARTIFEILKINFYLIIRKIEIYYGEEFTQKNRLYFNIFDYYLKENDLYDLKEKEIIEIINIF